MKMVAASIPEYFPSISFYVKLIQSDIFVIADNLQFSKHSPVNRTKIKSPNTWQWLTVPVVTSNLGLQKINDVKIVETSNWQRKHQTALKSYYKYAPYFDHYTFQLEHIFHTQWNSICNLDMTIMNIINKQLRLKKEIKMISDFDINKTGTDRIIKLVNMLNAKTYVIFESELQFIDREKVNASGIQLKILSDQFKTYNQQFEPFTPNLSILDVLYNLGNESINYLLSSIN